MNTLVFPLFFHFRRTQLPLLVLLTLLQRTPVLRLLIGAESVWISGGLGQVLRATAVVAASVGAVDTLAGATTFTASPASPAAATVGTPFNAAFAVTGAPSIVASYTITGLPPGLTVTGATTSGSNLLLNSSTGTITGTPTTNGSYIATITAWERTNAAGKSKGYNYTITVTGGVTATAPSITAQPGNLTVTAGQSAAFSVTATGTAPLSYQWSKDGAAIAGATNSSHTLASAATGDAGSYTVVVTNTAGSATSTSATLTVSAANTATAPAITTQPVSQTVTSGAAVTFTVAASGTAPLSYQWSKDGAAIAGATNSSHSLASAAAGDAGSYTVVVTNSAGSATSNAATLTVSAANTATAPAITTQPVSQTVTTGGAATFSVAASGTAPLSYQWRKDGATIAGATNSSYSLASATAGDAGSYTVVVTNSAGSATSNAATLTVNTVSTPVVPGTPSNPSTTLPHITSLAFDGSGRLYVADSTNGTIQRIGADGTVYLVAGATGQAGAVNGTGAAALFNQPGGVASTAAGTLYVADTANAIIRRIGTDGAVTTLAGSTIARGNTDGSGAGVTFSAPTGLVLDASGNLYVADTTNHTIRRVTTTGVVSTFAGLAGASGNANGNAGAARFNQPAAVAVDAAGNLCVADKLNNTIRRITSAGSVSTLAGLAGVSGSSDGAGGGALFNQPQGLAFDSAGNLYVADTGNSVIRKVTPAGVVTTVAGLPTVSGEDDSDHDGGDDDDTPTHGESGFASFNHPLALAVAANGDIYVGDTGNASIRVIGSGGGVTTLTLRLASTGTTPNPVNTGSNVSTGTTGNSNSSPPAAGGGGGAASHWFVTAFSLLLGWRRLRAAPRHP